MANPTPPQLPTALNVQLNPDQEVGVFADFAMVWHTPNTFVIDFVAVKQPEHPGQAPDGRQVSVLEARIGSRVRIPPEQIFRLIEALQLQAAQWMKESGRSEPPNAWFPQEGPPADPEPPTS